MTPRGHGRVLHDRASRDFRPPANHKATKWTNLKIIENDTPRFGNFHSISPLRAGASDWCDGSKTSSPTYRTGCSC